MPNGGPPQIKEFLKARNIHFSEDHDMARNSYFGTGGNVKTAIFPRNKRDLQAVLRFCHDHGLSYRIFGATSNCLFLNEGVFDIFILTKYLNGLGFDGMDGLITALAGTMMPALAKKAAQKGYTGFEGLCGIPGTVGGGVYMNAGAYGNEISDHLVDVLVLNGKGEETVFKKEQLEYRFRHSLFRDKDLGVIVEARFKAPKGDPEEINKKIDQCAQHRKDYQENEFPNLGSLFATFDIYEEIRKYDPLYRTAILLDKIYCKLFHPRDNKFLNFLTNVYFRFPFQERPYSDKTLNCLINTGDNYNEVLHYVEFMQKLTRYQLPLENEIIGPWSDNVH